MRLHIIASGKGGSSMMCYKDMTFCTYWHLCADAEGCARALTPDVMEKAMEWMENPPICMFSEEPSCLNKKEN